MRRICVRIRLARKFLPVTPNMAVFAALKVRLTPAVRALVAAPALSSRAATWAATKEEEQAVSMLRQAAFNPKE